MMRNVVIAGPRGGQDRQAREAAATADRRNVERITIAIDGPAAAGKSTVGDRVARRLSAVFFDTGVLYRAVTRAALAAGVPTDDGEALTKLAEGLDIRIERPSVADGRQSDILLDGQDVTRQLRTPEIDRAVSPVSAHPAVRAALLPVQRRIGRAGRVVMVGRDISTVVLPEAELKIYLDASPEVRARRRCEQEALAGVQLDERAVLADILRRDQLDSQRAAAPLRAADDAVIIDTDPLTIDEVVERIVAEAERRGVHGC
jgi:cytidylate kinase